MKEWLCHDCQEAIGLTAFGDCPNCHGSNVERIHSAVIKHAQEMTGIEKENRCA